MCLIIDTCTFHAVFNSKDANHVKYAPVFSWIKDKKAKIIIGGTKYRNELIGYKYLAILGEYEKKNQVVKLADSKVDALAKELLNKVSDGDFDDEHLVAMVIVSKCRIVCTKDDRAVPYLQNRNLYPSRFKRPRIYKTARNANLCCHENVVDICK